MELSNWKCQQCGHCCKNIKSLMISTNESKFFPKHLLIPEVAYGRNRENLTIIYYQIISTACPLYKDGCSIYDNRPLICKTYPLMKNTLAKCENIDKSVFSEFPITSKASPELMKCQDYAQELIEKITHFKSTERLWKYNVKSKKWTKMNK